MIFWMITAAVLAVACIVLGVVCARLRAQLKLRGMQSEALEELQRQLRIKRGEVAHGRREIAALNRMIDEEQERSDAFEAELNAMDEQLAEAEHCVRNAENRRIAAEKDVYAAKMKANLLEKQLNETRQGQAEMEKMVRDLIREKDEALARLGDQQKRRARSKKNDVIDQQVTLSDILKGA